MLPTGRSRRIVGHVALRIHVYCIVYWYTIFWNVWFLESQTWQLKPLFLQENNRRWINDISTGEHPVELDFTWRKLHFERSGECVKSFGPRDGFLIELVHLVISIHGNIRNTWMVISYKISYKKSYWKWWFGGTPIISRTGHLGGTKKMSWTFSKHTFLRRVYLVTLWPFNCLLLKMAIL